MLLKDHVSWSSRRGQRCLSFAVIILVIMSLATFESIWPKKTELQLSSLTDFDYNSIPEAGKPKLPFRLKEEWDDDVGIQERSLKARAVPTEWEKKEGILIGLH